MTVNRKAHSPTPDVTAECDFQHQNKTDTHTFLWPSDLCTTREVGSHLLNYMEACIWIQEWWTERRSTHLLGDVGPESLDARDGLGPVQEVHGHAVEQPRAPGAGRQADV
jgi:hypothetical protein